MTVTVEVYHDIIRDFITLLEPNEQFDYFQQDGVHPHTVAETITFLKDFFGEYLVSTGIWSID